MLPMLALSYSRPVRAEVFAELKALLATAGTPIEIEERDELGPQAGLEWLLPTAVILFIGKAYFEGFLKEMGKEHYDLLKQGLKSLYERLVGAEAPLVTIVSSAGKTRATTQYSLVFSLLAEAADGLRFKLLIRQGATQEDYEAAVAAFIDFLEAFHAKTLSPQVINELSRVRVIGRTLLLAYSAEHNRVVPVDPLEESRA
jgi:hypothetical protein